MKVTSQNYDAEFGKAVAGLVYRPNRSPAVTNFMGSAMLNTAHGQMPNRRATHFPSLHGIHLTGRVPWLPICIIQFERFGGRTYP